MGSLGTVTRDSVDIPLFHSPVFLCIFFINNTQEQNVVACACLELACRVTGASMDHVIFTSNSHFQCAPSSELRAS
jgi:hypothetical protein